MEQEVSLDGQMILMDALRVFDERERDRQSGKNVPSYEDLFTDVISSEGVPEPAAKGPLLTADDLGLADLDHLERKMPQFSPADELFDPVEMHRQKIRETLLDFSVDEQEAIVAFLEKSAAVTNPYDRPPMQESRSRALILFSEDEFIKHSVLTICKNEGILSFASQGEEELDNIVGQCLAIKALPLLVFDAPEASDGILNEEKIAALRRQIKGKHPLVATVQMVSSSDYRGAMKAYHDGVRAVFTRPSAKTGRATFIEDAILFLQTFTAYIKGFFNERNDGGTRDESTGQTQGSHPLPSEHPEPS